MHTLITSYFLQNKECILPGIGILQIKKIPAIFNSDTRQLLPPSDEIVFNNKFLTTSPGLAKYIAHQQSIEQYEAEELLETFCNEWKEKMNKGEELNFETIGKLHNNENGKITFEKGNSFIYLKPITIDNPYIKVAEKAPGKSEPAFEDDTIGDERGEDDGPENREPVFAQESVGNENIVPAKSYWVYWAAALFVIGAALVFFHFKDHKFSGLNTGNKSKFAIDSAGATYTRPK